MTDNRKAKLGDVLLLATDSAPFAHTELVALLAKKYEVSPQSLADEINGSSILARIARDLLGLERVPKKMGAPKNEYAAWQIYDRVERGRIMGSSVAETIKKLVKEAGGENAKASMVSTFTKRYNRERKDRGKMSLQGLFQQAPPETEN